MSKEVTRERMLSTLATLLMVYIESHRRIPDLERDLEDGAVKAIRALIENRPEVNKDMIIKYRNLIVRHFWGREMDEMGKEFLDFTLEDMLHEIPVTVKEG